MNTCTYAGRRSRSLVCRRIGDFAACPEWGIDPGPVCNAGRIGALAPAQLAQPVQARGEARL